MVCFCLVAIQNKLFYQYQIAKLPFVEKNNVVKSQTLFYFSAQNHQKFYSTICISPIFLIADLSIQLILWNFRIKKEESLDSTARKRGDSTQQNSPGNWEREQLAGNSTARKCWKNSRKLHSNKYFKQVFRYYGIKNSGFSAD